MTVSSATSGATGGSDIGVSLTDSTSLVASDVGASVVDSCDASLVRATKASTFHGDGDVPPLADEATLDAAGPSVATASASSSFSVVGKLTLLEGFPVSAVTAGAAGTVGVCAGDALRAAPLTRSRACR